jgi:NhaA family Na+:H+ antiporter
LERETTSGLLLLGAAVIAMTIANVWPDFYFGVRDFHLIEWDLLGLKLHLTVGEFAADGLLAIFFFLVGLELKREFVAGDLHDPRTAIVPIVAAFGGVAGPAIIYIAINWNDAAALRGWAVPVATDIAFAVGVLAVIGSHLPAAMRTFLLTLAVTDDLIGIAIIAIAYATDLHLGFLGLSLIPMAGFCLLVQFGRQFIRRYRVLSTIVLTILAVITWALFFNSGIHATISGVVLGFLVPVGSNGQGAGLAQSMEDKVRPISAGFAAPVFAFFTAGVAFGGWEHLQSSLTSTIGLGIIIGLPVGKAIGIFGSTWLVTRLRNANLDPDIKWIDVFGLAVVGGVGFTVALLVNQISFEALHPDYEDIGKVAVITASVLSALIGGAILASRNRHYRDIASREAVDANLDGIPDVFTDDSDD